MSTSSPARFHPAQIAEIAAMFSALADPSRLTILNALRPSPAFVTELCHRTGLKQANVSKQLSLLRQAGMVQSHRRGNHIQYHICEPMIFELCDLVCSKLRRDSRRRAAMFQ